MGTNELRTVHTERGRRLAERREVMASLDSATAEQLRSIVQSDALTGALSRDYGLTLADRSSYLTLIDLDGFKSVNDTFGHSAGDVVLATMAHRLSRFGTLVRLGGDEFLLCTERAPAQDELAQAVSAPIALDLHGTAVRVGLSAGTVCQSDYPHSVDDALSAADARMYASKTARGAERRAHAR